MTELFVHMNGRLVGALDASDRRSLRFRYDPGYASDPAATPLSVSMPLRQTAYSHAVVHPYLWGLLPDNDRVIERWAREFSCSSSDVAGLLRGVGTDVAGAAQYIGPGVTPEECQPGGISWVTDADIAQFLSDVRRDTSAWRPHPEGRWSLAGAQAKIALLYDSQLARWGVPHGSMPTTHIIKPAIAGLDDFDINEHLCLAAARKLGMVAAATSIQTFGEQRALVVERYDRVRSTDGSILRVHQEDLCQALSAHPDRKYESDGGPGAAQLGRLVTDVAGRQDPARLLDALAYNWLLLAPDGHAKNFSLLLSGHQVRLAPLYDVASGLPHLHPREARLAQKIGGEKRPLFVSAKHWDRTSRDFGIDPASTRQRIATLIAGMPDAFADATEKSDFTVGERRIANQIRDLVAKWLVTCQLSMQEPER